MFEFGVFCVYVFCNISFRGTNKNKKARKTDNWASQKPDTVGLLWNFFLVSFKIPIFKNVNHEENLSLVSVL